MNDLWNGRGIDAVAGAYRRPGRVPKFVGRFRPSLNALQRNRFNLPDGTFVTATGLGMRLSTFSSLFSWDILNWALGTCC